MRCSMGSQSWAWTLPPRSIVSYSTPSYQCATSGLTQHLPYTRTCELTPIPSWTQSLPHIVNPTVTPRIAVTGTPSTCAVENIVNFRLAFTWQSWCLRTYAAERCSDWLSHLPSLSPLTSGNRSGSSCRSAQATLYACFCYTWLYFLLPLLQIYSSILAHLNGTRHMHITVGCSAGCRCISQTSQS